MGPAFVFHGILPCVAHLYFRNIAQQSQNVAWFVTLAFCIFTPKQPVKIQNAIYSSVSNVRFTLHSCIS